MRSGQQDSGGCRLLGHLVRRRSGPAVLETAGLTQARDGRDEHGQDDKDGEGEVWWRERGRLTIKGGRQREREAAAVQFISGG